MADAELDEDGRSADINALFKVKGGKSGGSKFVKKAGSNVYVSGLPEDVEQEELLECFKVAGLLKTDPATKEFIRRKVRHAVEHASNT